LIETMLLSFLAHGAFDYAGARFPCCCAYEIRSFLSVARCGFAKSGRSLRRIGRRSGRGRSLGFNTIWLAEVHFTPRFCLMPAPLLQLAAIAERTARLRLGIAVNLLPLHHPVRLAEEIATLDVLSGGRVEFGAGRGAFPSNYRGYGVDMSS